MKVRIGFGLGRETTCSRRVPLAALADGLEERGFDSLWFSERLGSQAPDPVAAMGFVVGRTERLKVGVSIMVLPGRNLPVLAQELATLDQLAGGHHRVLPAFGLGAPEAQEHSAFGVSADDRGERFDEALPILRRLWSGDWVTHHGRHYDLDRVSVRPTPIEGRFDIWIGAMSREGLERVGRLSDGWVASFCVPQDVAEALPIINEAADKAGRSIDPEHIGAPIIYRKDGPLFAPLARQVMKRHPGLDPEVVVPPGIDGVVQQIENLIAVGASKFVVLPTAGYPTTADLYRELDEMHARILPLQT